MIKSLLSDQVAGLEQELEVARQEFAKANARAESWHEKWHKIKNAPSLLKRTREELAKLKKVHGLTVSQVEGEGEGAGEFRSVCSVSNSER